MQPVSDVFEGQTATRQVPLMGLQTKMPQNNQNNVFRSKQTTNKVPPIIFRGFQVRKRVRLMF